ncbi:MAG: YjjG family noncanonical pyrimidine nucleotidase [Clostridia bacterium]|nr:YjjG family noncanonical pyrimidine nucleotidase [Clostridia bacterium]
MKYTTALFDLDGTLLDFASAEKQGFFAAMEKHGIPCDINVYERYSAINDSLWKAFERKEITKEEIGTKRYEILFEEMNITADAQQVGKDYKARLAGMGILYDGALELCERLVSKGIKLYAVTNGTAHIQANRMAVSGLDKVFIKTFVSEEIGFRKPDKEYFDYVFENIEEKDKHRILIIGDSPTSDIKGGINAGIDTCYFAAEPHPDISPTYIAGSYDEVEKIILQ